jgi:glycosyltransferase involved in cell wall biosynthesis
VSANVINLWRLAYDLHGKSQVDHWRHRCRRCFLDVMDVAPIFDAVSRTRAPRFDRIAVTSVFGDPRAPRTWSGAPANVAAALERHGVRIEGIAPHIGRFAKLRIAATEMLAGRGRPLSGEQVLRSLGARRRHAEQVAAEAERIGVHHVLHTGTFDLPIADPSGGIRHYLYCDHTWALSQRHHVHADRYTRAALRAFEETEQRALEGLAHVFTFGAYVRDNLIDHYRLSPDRVTAVGSGMGAIEPFTGPRDYSRPKLLFVAKHLFRAKGGELLLGAFEKALGKRPDLRLTVVGDERSRQFVPDLKAIEFRAHLPWDELQQMYRSATLLVQPMLNDPWGQVYLEAMVSRTPVMGLARNGLPELTDGGRHGFLVDRADPEALAQAIVCAVSDPARLERMGWAAQRHVLGNFNWDLVAERMLYS